MQREKTISDSLSLETELLHGTSVSATIRYRFLTKRQRSVTEQSQSTHELHVRRPVFHLSTWHVQTKLSMGLPD